MANSANLTLSGGASVGGHGRIQAEDDEGGAERFADLMVVGMALRPAAGNTIPEEGARGAANFDVGEADCEATGVFFPHKNCIDPHSQ